MISDSSKPFQPLAARMRPRNIHEFIGQNHLLGEGKPLRQTIDSGRVHSMIFWGPPGTGKTTLARLISQACDSHFIAISAVFSGVKEIRAAVSAAQAELLEGKQSILFVDEVHRFNKSQQDAFLPYVEDGTLTLIGATTENPSFELNNALLSRAKVYVLKPLQTSDIVTILKHALKDEERGLGSLHLNCDAHTLELIANASDGDARRALNFLDVLAEILISQGEKEISADLIKDILSDGVRRFDKGGEYFYDQISALHKSVRGSDPDAALYWLSRMLDGGCDPLYIARRVIRMASEDIGNADPRALTLAVNAAEVQERLGSPEGELTLAQAIIYMACAPKSNATYVAFKAAMHDAKNFGTLDVPLHIRNAPTRLMRELDYGKDYHYSHNYQDAFTAGENYFPEGMPEKHYYEPVDRGLEMKIREKLLHLRELNRQAKKKKK